MLNQSGDVPLLKYDRYTYFGMPRNLLSPCITIIIWFLYLTNSNQDRPLHRLTPYIYLSVLARESRSIQAILNRAKRPGLNS